MYNLKLTEEEFQLLMKSISWLTEKSSDENNKFIFANISEKLSYLNKRDSGKSDVVSYLKGASEGAIKLYNYIEETYQINIYHSIASIYDNQTRKNSLITKDEFFKYYLNAKCKKWPDLIEWEKELRDLFDHYYIRNKI